MHKISSSQTRVKKKSSHKHFVTYDGGSAKTQLQNTLVGVDDIENSNLKNNDIENIYAKLSPFIKNNIFEKLTVVPYAIIEASFRQ